MMFGAMFLGNLGDRFGRKRVIVDGTILYALHVAAVPAGRPIRCSWASCVSSPGIGLGGVLPNVIALTAEISPPSKRAKLTSIPIIGMSLGSGLPAVVAAWLVPIYGWKALFVVGGIVPIIVALVIAWKLPESLLFLTYRGKRPRRDRARACSELDPALQITPDTQFMLRSQAAGESQRGSVSDLFRGALRFTTPLLWVMFACTLLSMHFINSWISVMLKPGRTVASSRLRSPTACCTGAAPSPPSSRCSCWGGWVCTGR